MNTAAVQDPDPEDTVDRYHLVFDNTSDAVLVYRLDEHGRPERFEEVNDRACSMLGYTRAELLSLPPLALRAADDDQRLKDMRRTVATDGGGPVEATLLRKDGTEMSTEVRRKVLEGKDGGRILAFVRDTSARKEIESRLRATEASLALAQEAAHIGSWELQVVDEDDLYASRVLWSDEVFRIFGYPPEGIGPSARAVFASIHPDDAVAIENAVTRAIHDGAPYDIEHRVRRPDGSERIVHAVCRSVSHRETGLPIKLLGTVQDVTASVEEQRKLRLATQAMDASSTGIIIAGVRGGDCPIVHVNRAFERITGFSRGEVIGRDCRFLQALDRDQAGAAEIRRAVAEQREGRGLLRNYRKDGSMFWNDLTLTPVKDGSGRVTHFLGMQNDVTDFKKMEEQLEHGGRLDKVTGLPNRELVEERIQQAIDLAPQKSQSVAILFLDIDGFGQVDETLGHGGGDSVLREIADRLLACMRGGDTVARIGDDQFVVVCLDVAGEADFSRVTRQASTVLAEPFHVSDETVHLTCTIGVSTYPEDGDDPATLLRAANLAMHRGKELGHNRIEFFTSELNDRVTRRIATERELRDALDRNEMELHFQPQIALDSRRIVGVEALMRWRHPSRGLLAPADFMSIAEQSGLMVPLGRWAIEAACAQGARWHQEGHRQLSVSVNVSAAQVLKSDVVDSIEESLSRTGFAASCLDIELTESLMMGAAEVFIDRLKALKALGVSVSIDDFGTGYSSLSHLKRFPMDRIKIDRAFIGDIVFNPDDAAIVKAIVAMAHHLNLQVTAEGVETEEQAQFLRRNHCDAAQGYLFGRPALADDIGPLLGRSVEQNALQEPVRPNRSLLLVDDDPNVLQALKRVFRREAYDVLTADSAAAGLQVLAQTAVAVVVSDQRMPGMSGTEFLRRVASIHPETVRVMLSGYTDLATVTQAVNEGAIYKFLTKPWEDNVLRNDIRLAFLRYDQGRAAAT